MKFVTRYWYQPALRPPIYLTLLSFAVLLASKKRRYTYLKRKNISYRAPVPVIVVGNITAGGTGKTPVVIALSHFLQGQGINVGIISRGYGGKSPVWPVEVNKNSDAMLVGDEPRLIAQYTQSPMFVGPNRKADIEVLLKHYPDIDVILSDDGMQHYAMARDIEIAVIDGQRLFGNKKLMPAGPLREPISRLNDVDIQVINGGTGDIREIVNNGQQYLMQLKPSHVYSLKDEKNRKKLSDFAGQQINVIAGIGNPQRFFDMLISQRIEVIAHEFEDHHQFIQSDLEFDDNLPIIMTEKDAVKCVNFNLAHCWVVAVDAEFSEAFYDKVLSLLERLPEMDDLK